MTTKEIFYFKSHVPNCVDAPRAIEQMKFSDITDVLNYEWVKNWSKDPNFHRFSIGCNVNWNSCHLMCELDEGREWWVVGTIFDENFNPYNKNTFNLPNWIPIKKHTKNTHHF